MVCVGLRSETWVRNCCGASEQGRVSMLFQHAAQSRANANATATRQRYAVTPFLELVMRSPELPDRDMFAKDPGGYSRSGWMRWAMLSALHGADVDPMAPPSSDDLKSPILWLTQAQAMTQAAITLTENKPPFDTMPPAMRGICDTQYCGVALMLVGFSLEVSLKAMLILRQGVAAYTEAEKKHHHHKLHELADFIPGLTEKELGTLKMLAHFVAWAGRYPDPGPKQIDKHEDIFALSEQHEICARDVFQVAARVMQHVGAVLDAHENSPQL